MARYQCRACDFDGYATWNGKLVCPRCNNCTEVRAAIPVEEMTEVEVAAINAATPEDGSAPEYED